MVYLDYNASNPLRAEVRLELQQFLAEPGGNPSSLHAHGRHARAGVEKVRAELLEALGDPAGELVFTSGGTEANNLALKGVAWRLRSGGKDHLVVSGVEHHAVLHAAEALGAEGIQVSVVAVDENGRVDLQALERSVTSRTMLISVMQANNEVGTIQPIAQVGRIARERGVLFHTDAVQGFTKCPLDVRHLQVDLVSLSGHKLGGLKGVGALYVRKGVELAPLLHGGPHERRLRAGTENAAGIAAFGTAVQCSLKEQRNGTLLRVQQLRDQLQQGLKEVLPEVEINGHPSERLPGTLNVSFPGCDGETLLIALDLAGISVSTGSACSSGSTSPSHVLVAMRLGPERIRGSIRFSLGWGTTEEEIEEALKRIPPVVERVRQSQIKNLKSTI